MGIKERLGKIAAFFQPAYRKIDEWDLPWLREICRDLWSVLGDDMKKAIYAFVIALVKEYGETKAREILGNIKERLDIV